MIAKYLSNIYIQYARFEPRDSCVWCDFVKIVDILWSDFICRVA